jgi:hypothetical protein
MKKNEKSPLPEKEIEKFLKSNPKIKEALDLFKVSEEQYLKALESTQPQITTSNKNIIEIMA